jgi:glycosyltransferase involved in cell wall biosynthesis
MVGISLLTLVPGVVGGSETYARQLVRGLARVGDLDYHVYVPPNAADAADGLPSTVVTAYRGGSTMPRRILAMSLAAAAPGRIRRQVSHGSMTAVHYPLTVALPRLREVPAAATVLDLQHELYPSFFSRAELAYRKVVYGATVRRCRTLIAISEHVKGTLVERLGVESERVHAVHLGIDHERFRPSGAEREHFLLYPANCWPHKNHDRLFEAFALVRRVRPELQLVLTGAGHEGHVVPEGIVVRGRVPDAELVSLYEKAAAVVFPSLYEGFGQPPLEAMACGCPVAASTAGALPEVLGDAARYFDPTSAEDMAAAMLDVLGRTDELVPKGIARAALFSWDACARRHEDVYRGLGEGG